PGRQLKAKARGCREVRRVRTRTSRRHTPCVTSTLHYSPPLNFRFIASATAPPTLQPLVRCSPASRPAPNRPGHERASNAPDLPIPDSALARVDDVPLLSTR